MKLIWVDLKETSMKSKGNMMEGELRVKSLFLKLKKEKVKKYRLK